MKEEPKNTTEEKNVIKISVENNKILENVSADKVIEAFKKLKEQQSNN